MTVSLVLRRPCLLLAVMALSISSGIACVQLDDCPATDITCNATGWLLYLQSANASSTTPALCSAGTADAAFFSYQGGAGTQALNEICATRDGGSILAGRSTADIASLGGATPVLAYDGGTDALIIKLDSVNAVEWYSFAGGTGNDEFFAVTELSDGGFVAVGEASFGAATINGIAPIVGFQGIPTDSLVVRFSATGNVEWWSFFGIATTSNDESLSVVELSDGGIVVGGHAGDLSGMPVANLSTFSGGQFDQTFVKFSSAGTIEWYRTLGSTVNEQSREIVATQDGGFVSVGFGLGNMANVGGSVPIITRHGNQDTLVAKFNTDGGLEWFTWLGQTGGNQVANTVTELADGSLVVGMDATSTVTSLDGKAPLNGYNVNDIYLAKLSATGALEWHTFLPTAVGEVANHVVALSDGSFLVGGTATADAGVLTASPPLTAYDTNDDIILVKMSADGTEQWFSYVGGVSDDQLFGLAATQDGGFVLSGQSNSNITGLGALSPLATYSGSGFDGFVLRGTADGPY